MSDDRFAEARSGTPRGAAASFRDAWASRATWQRVAAVVSLALTLVTGGVAAVQAWTAPAPAEVATTARSSASQDPPPSDPSVPGLTGGLWQGPPPPPLPGEEPGPDEPGAEPEESEPAPTGWSPALFKLGFSFFMGFAIAFAVRSFVRISLVAIGMMALLLFGLEYIGLVRVEWQVMGDRWDDVVAWLEPQVTSFHGFIAGQLPSAGAAIAGLATGWRRG